MTFNSYGISAISVYLPSNRVSLNAWASWNDQKFEKINNVIGTGFRLPSPSEDVYTLAANACLKLIENYSINPENIGFIGLGTESSRDNALGAIIVKGLLNDALHNLGYKTIGRECEVPEYKHACLAGVYAVKGGLRYLQGQKRGRCALIVSSDIAKYNINSTGEATQGSGAVAILLESNPKLLEIDINNTVSSSAFRHIDFRKPLKSMEFKEKNIDLALVNGKYSSFCYLDEVKAVTELYLNKHKISSQQLFSETDHFFFHRPFKRMPENALAYLYLRSILSENGQLKKYCELANLSLSTVVHEQKEVVDFGKMIKNQSINENIHPETNKLISYLRESTLLALFNKKLSLGNTNLSELGNIYSGSLFAWIASALEDALTSDLDITTHKWLAVGYGSGNAAEIIPMKISKNWADYACKINFKNAFKESYDLTQEEYKKVHQLKYDLDFRPPITGFKISKFGNQDSLNYSDKDIPYYTFLGSL
jgi:hydroxymethylglutaryl-CoA synthase